MGGWILRNVRPGNSIAHGAGGAHGWSDRDIACRSGQQGDPRLASPPEEMGLFARTERLYCRLIDACGKHKVRVEGTMALRVRHRFATASLQRVESSLFGDDSHAGDSRVETAEKTERTGSVEIWECSDPETEVRVAAQAIREWVVRGDGIEQHPLRYRDIGLMVPDLEGTHDAISRIFAEHQIPHFIDQRRSIAHHPLVELLRSAVAIEMSRWDQDEVLLYLKTGLAGIDEGDVAVVENYVIGHGITRIPWSGEWRWVAPNQKDEDAGIPVREDARVLLAHVNALAKKSGEIGQPHRPAVPNLSRGCRRS